MKLNAFGFLLSAFCLLGCTVKESAKVANVVDQDFINAYEAFEMSKNPRGKISGDTISSSEGVWLGHTSVIPEHGYALPKQFENDTGITIVMGDPVGLQAVANNITSITGINVKLDSHMSAERADKKMRIAYTGPLSGLLNHVSTDMDLFWTYDGNSVIVRETETKTFTLFALGTDVNFQSQIRTDDGNGVALESNLKEWEEIERAINSIVETSSNTKFTVSRSLGTITVTAPPSIQSRVSTYIAKQNQKLSQLVTIDVKVLQVSIQNSSAFGLNLLAAINNAKGLNIVANPYNNLSQDSTSNLNIAVLSNAVSAMTGATHLNQVGEVVGGAYTADQIANNKLSGTNALIQALAKQGKVSLVTNVGVTTRSNRVAPVSNIRTTGYIKRFESRNFTTVESSTVDQDELETGFSMQLLPNVLDNGKVLLLFKMSIRELLDMRQQKIGAVTLQLPEVEERAFMQEVIMESGQMLVLSGFERTTNDDTRYGIGKADFMALSGSRETATTREVLVIILNPIVLASPMDAERNIQQNWGAPLN